jgi:hypothetical protein
MQTPDHLILPDLIPNPDLVRRRLAVALAEADLLRSQLRISERLTRERERLREQKEDHRRAS